MLRHSKALQVMYHFFVLLTVAGCEPSCNSTGSPAGLTHCRLARDGYSVTTRELILDIFVEDAESIRGRGLSVYSEKTDMLSVLSYPAADRTNDFAWVPGQAVFVVTHRGGMILFRRDPSVNGYRGTAIRCPVEVEYRSCAWSPSGECLAVACYNLVQPVGYRLGLFNLKEERFVMSDIVARGIGLVWADDTTVYVANDDGAVEVRLESGVPRVVRTIPTRQGLVRFYGMFDGQPLIYTGDELQVGQKTLLKRNSAKGFSAVGTKTSIFVSASPTLIVFDGQGREVCRANPRKTIRLGSVGGDPNIVYGVSSDLILVRISAENEGLRVEDVSDLAAK